MRGRKPTPIEQRMANGNPGKRPVPAPVSVGGRPRVEQLDPPDHMPEEAKDFWKFAVDELVEVGIVDKVDIPVLEQLATQYARIRQAQAAIERFGHFTRGSTGQIVEHPAVKMERDATNLFLKLAEQYALTPVARTRLGLAELHRRSMADEMDERIGTPDLTPA